MMRIVPFSPALAPAFASLNRAWIERLFALEAADLEVLNDPGGSVIDPGGEIFFALVDDRVVGTAAAIPDGAGRYELAKMAVDPDFQGAGIGFALGQAVTDWARGRQAHVLFLLTNSSLDGAIRLYERLGFRHAPLPSSTGYQRADVYMEMRLRPGIPAPPEAPPVTDPTPPSSRRHVVNEIHQLLDQLGDLVPPSRDPLPVDPVLSTAADAVLRPIGVVVSPLTSVVEAPKQGNEGAPDAWIAIHPEFVPGLAGLEVGAEIVMLTWLDRADRDLLQVHPRDNLAAPLAGVFATRSADRPNPIGLHPVRLHAIDGHRLRVGPLEAIDGTPVLDLKPVL